jgi:glutamate synthase (NADPH/NADH) small chain
VAIGNSPNPIIPATTPELETERLGNIKANQATGKTSLERIWIGSDIMTGAVTIILALGADRLAARSMHKYLMGQETW